MKVTIECACHACFDIYSNGRNKGDYICPSCGRTLPDDASKALHAMFENFKEFEARLQHADLYDYSISR